MQPTMCSRCGKNVAVVFITKIEAGQTKNEGLCLKCARELHIKPVDDVIEKMGISDEDLEALSGDMMNALNGAEDLMAVDGDGDSDEDDGKTATFPFLNRLFGGPAAPNNNQNQNNGGSERPRSEQKEPPKGGKRKFLDNYCIDLTQRAREGKLDAMIGREEELERVIQILNRRQKNNPCLIGEPGVGKTAIAEGLAQRIAMGNVPCKLQDKQVFLLDLTALVAGTQFRGQFESRMKGLIEEIRKQGNIILVIDEVHNIVGAGDAEGSMNAANILKPALSRGEIQVIGATTFTEYRKHIEKDSALERRFQPVTVTEPSIEDSIRIIRGVSHYYEDYHGVEISDEMCRQAVLMSERYITDRFLPDKAIDLVDEAGSRLRMELDSMPSDIDAQERQLTQMQIEEQALMKEDDEASAERLQTLRHEIADAREKLDAAKAAWQNEKGIIDLVQQLKSQIDEARIEEERATRSGDLMRASELRYSTIPKLEADYRDAEQRLRAKQEAGANLKEEVTADEIAAVVSAWTGVPVSKMMQGDMEKLRHLEEHLKERVIGQDEAVHAVASAVRRSRAGLSDPDRPLGSFLFMGPTGVGKTELAKALAEALFDDERAMVRIDMSEYMEKFSVQRLIGAPPGYVGYDEGGQLTEAVRRHPYTVVLLDELEKAHPDVFNVLLQVLDDGRLTDGQGRVVSFKNAIIIMTSNLGSQFILETTGKDELQQKMQEVLKQAFRPEFVNRIDDVVYFNSLGYADIERIVDLQLDDVRERLARERLSMTVTPSAMDALSLGGLDPAFGARPLRRLIQNKVVDGIANLIIDGKLSENDVVRVDVDNDGNIVVVKDEEASSKARAQRATSPEDVPVEPDSVE